jgi:hypothetical protein
MDKHTDSCWADALDSRERAVLARKLARYGERFYKASGTPAPLQRRRAMSQHQIQVLPYALMYLSDEMADLHHDLTERACTAPDTARRWDEAWAAKSDRRQSA